MGETYVPAPGELVIIRGSHDFWGDEPDDIGLVIAFDPAAQYPHETRATVLVTSSGRLQWCPPYTLVNL